MAIWDSNFDEWSSLPNHSAALQWLTEPEQELTVASYYHDRLHVPRSLTSVFAGYTRHVEAVTGDKRKGQESTWRAIRWFLTKTGGDSYKVIFLNWIAIHRDDSAIDAETYFWNAVETGMKMGQLYLAISNEELVALKNGDWPGYDEWGLGTLP